jgi:hypothetical protein
MPRKTFVAGTLATASDVNTYLMDQSVMTFASAAARTTALPSPIEGMTTYLEDTNELTVYDGSAWRIFNTSWTAYTPTYSNFTLGSGGTIVGFYSTSGRMTTVHVLVTFGSGMSFTGNVTIGLPSNRAYVSTPRFMGHTRMAAGGATYPGSVIASGGNMIAYAHTANSMHVGVAAVSASVPGSWAINNTLLIQATYES